MVWTIIIGAVIFFGIKYQFRIELEASKTFEMMPVVLFATIFPVVIGLFLRLPRLISEIKENKQWTFDWMKFVPIAIPTLYVLIIYILPFTSIGINSIQVPHFIIVGSPTIQVIAGIIFGYILLDSLKK